MKLTAKMIRLRLKASQTLISLVENTAENTGTGKNLPVGKKVKFEPLLVESITSRAEDSQAWNMSTYFTGQKLARSEVTVETCDVKTDLHVLVHAFLFRNTLFETLYGKHCNIFFINYSKEIIQKKDAWVEQNSWYFFGKIKLYFDVLIYTM